MQLSSAPNDSLTDNCIILDIDNTLIEAQFDGELPAHFHSDAYKSRRFQFAIEGESTSNCASDSKTYHAVLRPMTHAFLTYIFKYFKLVCVWSLGKRPYVHAVVEQIFANHAPPHAVLSYEHSTLIPRRSTLTKPIRAMIDANDLCRRHMRLDNTLIIDDNVHNFYHNPRNGVLIPQFTLKKVARSYHNDISLLVLMLWLHANKDENLVKLPKSTIFKCI